MIGTIKISQLPISSLLDGSENLIINQVGVTKLTTVDDVVGLVTYFAADATPQPLGTAAIGVSTDYAREDHVHAMPTAADVGADPDGTASSAISTHEAAADPHPGYALESDLGGAALLDVGTIAGTVAAGDDSRLTTDLSYTASTRVLASSTGADVTLPLFTSTAAGLAPLSGGGTSNFLRADGTWAAPATGGTPGGTTGQIQWNSAGSFAGVSDSTVGALGDITLSLNGAASTPPFRLTGTWFTGGTATTTKPQVLIEPSGTTSTAWSTSGTGLGINAASGFAGNLLDLQVGGVKVFTIPTTGAAASYATSSPNTYFEISGSSAAKVAIGVGNLFGFSGCLSNHFYRLRTNNADRLELDTTGSVRIVTALTVATLPGTPSIGMIARVTDASAPAVGSTVAGGGAAAALVWWNGSNWTVIGV